jgi:type VI secretion system secreted protein Hcp
MATVEKQSDVFLDLKTAAKGESTDAAYSGQIEVDSWHVSASNKGEADSGTTGVGTGRVSLGSMHITAEQSAATLYLFNRCCTGFHIDEAVLTCRKAGGTQDAFHKITMETVLVTDHETGGSSSDLNNADSFTLTFGSIKHEHWQQKKDGTMEYVGAKKWDATTNKAS